MGVGISKPQDHFFTFRVLFPTFYFFGTFRNIYFNRTLCTRTTYEMDIKTGNTAVTTTTTTFSLKIALSLHIPYEAEPLPFTFPRWEFKTLPGKRPTEVSSEQILPIPFLSSSTFSLTRSSSAERHLYPHKQTLVRERPYRARQPSQLPLL